MSLCVWLVSRPTLDMSSILSYLSDVGLEWCRNVDASDPERLAELAGRVCKMSFSDRQRTVGANQFLIGILRDGHDSILEHVNWTFLVSGVSRSFSHQIVRHHIGISFSQMSQEYVDHGDASFVQPSVLADVPEALAIWKNAVHTALTAYTEISRKLRENRGLVERTAGDRSVEDIIRSVARSILPNATETTILMTANARALRHLFVARGNASASEEMRCLCALLLGIVESEAPAIFSDFSVITLPDGSPAVERNTHR